MKIQTISLTNFQNHKMTLIPIGQITALLGTSDCGKSAILRAIFWLTMNSPSGVDYTRHGEKTVSVIGGLGNGIRVERAKAPGFNGYRVYREGEETVEWNHIGQGVVPYEIQELFGLTPLNFQGQHDPAFMLSETAGKVGKMLNHFVDLSLIDTSIKKAKSMVAAEAAAEAEAGRMVLSLSEDILALPDTAGADKAIQTMERELLALEGLQEKRATLEHLKGRAKELSDARKALHNPKGAREALGVLGGLETALARAQGQRTLLQNRTDQLRGLVLRFAEFSDLDPAGDMLLAIRSLSIDLRAVASERAALSLALGEFRRLHALLQLIPLELATLKAQLPEVCTLCKQPIIK